MRPKGLNAEHLERTGILTDETVEAPVQEGQKLGTLELSYDGKVYATVDLLAMNDVDASKALVFWRDVQEFFAKKSVRIAIVVLVVLILVFLIWKLLFGRRRSRYGRSASRRSGGGYRGRGRRF